MKIQKFFRSYGILIFIVFISFALRIYQLGKVPISPDLDEASLGYNAYSILHTGRDEYGKFLPMVFRSFDDYKPGLYVYLTVPFVAIFGLNTFAVRLPAAIIGVLAVIGTYLLVDQLFPPPAGGGKKLPALAALMLAISPWHIQFSRIAFEAGVGVACNIYMALFFIKGLGKNKYFFLSVIFLALGMNVYQSERVFAPLLFLALILVYWEKIIKLSKNFVAVLFILFIILNFPFIYFVFTNSNAFARAKGVLIFNDPSVARISSQRLVADRLVKDKIGLIFDNRRIEYAKTIVANYLSHFDPNWLFINGDISRHHAPGMGLLYLWELPLFLIGMYMLIFGEYDKKVKLLIFSWFLLVPIPAAVTSGVPHAVRTINFLPLYQIFTAIGLFTSFKSISNIKYQISKILIKYLIFTLYFLFLIFNISYYLDQYFVQQNYFNALDWQYGYAKMIPYVKAHENSYKSIIVSNQPYMDQSYIFFLFYLQYNPQLYQEQSVNVSGGFREEHKFADYEFRQIDWSKEKKDNKILYIGRQDDFPPNAHIVYQVDFPDSKPAMLAVTGV